jgi:hypothetical protein
VDSVELGDERLPLVPRQLVELLRGDVQVDDELG